MMKKRKVSVKSRAKSLSKRASKILSESEKTRKQLSKKASRERKGSERDTSSAKKDKRTAKSTHKQVDFDIKVHKLETGDVKEAMHEMNDLECAVKDADYIIREAEKIKKKK